MSNELETAGLASLGGLSGGGKADLSGQPCRNCDEPVTGRHCPKCGQLAASFHRPFLGLIGDTISDSFAIDGRIARTLPLLLFRPGVLSRRYSEGKRARYLPPFRLLLLSSLLFYFVVFAFLGQVNWLEFANSSVDGEQLTDEEMTELRDRILTDDGDIDEVELQEFIRGLRDGAAGEVDAPAESPVAVDGPDSPDAPDAGPNPTEERVRRILEDPRLFVSAVETWLPRLSLLLVPLTMLAMAFMYFWHRRIYIYDHAIHALNLHSWVYIAATITMLFGLAIGAGLASAIFFLALPVYVTLSLRGAYRTGYFMSFLRMGFLMIFWTICAAILMTLVIVTSALSV